MQKDSLIFVVGHNGMVGSAITRALRDRGYANLLTANRAELDLLDQRAVFRFFEIHKPEYVFVTAAKVGGVVGNNTQPAPFIYDNLMIQANVIHAAHTHNVKKLLFLGSSCIYPKHAEQPMHEGVLLTGALEPTNEYYAIAKIAGIKLCEAYRKQYGKNFISAMPTNLYGPRDNYHAEHSHVIPGMIRKIHEAQEQGLPSVTLWGTGTPKREFLHVDDLADACLFLMENYNEGSHINVGTGVDMTIRELAETICDAVGYKGRILFDATRPDGTPRKLLDVSKLHDLGWKARISFEEGIRKTYAAFLEELQSGTLRGISQ